MLIRYVILAIVVASLNVSCVAMFSSPCRDAKPVDFYYDDLVKVVDGFYSGSRGKVDSIVSVMNKSRTCYYHGYRIHLLSSGRYVTLKHNQIVKSK